MARRKRRGFRLYVRHYCAKCGSRIFPYDKFEALTEAPKVGKSGVPVLLSTRNSDPNDRVAWCWACDAAKRGGWQVAVRLDERQILERYLARKGVVMRQEKWKPQLKKS